MLVSFSPIMFHRGTKYELTLELLNLINNGNKHPSDLMHDTHISRATFNRVISPLVSQGLLMETRTLGDVSFLITEKGELFREYLNKTLCLLVLNPASPEVD
jgi:predicted transcriptional regulator